VVLHVLLVFLAVNYTSQGLLTSITAHVQKLRSTLQLCTATLQHSKRPHFALSPGGEPMSFGIGFINTSYSIVCAFKKAKGVAAEAPSH
jgi:hypothetical protein